MPRLVAAFGGGPPLGEVWEGTTLLLPEDAPAQLTDALTGRELTVTDGRLALADVFAAFPGALLESLV